MAWRKALARVYGGLILPIKTLHLTNYWHERSGGISTFYRQLLQAAERSGRRMVLVVPGARDQVQEIGSGCRLYQLTAPASPLNPHYRTIYPREFLLPGTRIQRILAAERPQLVEICDKYSLIYLAPLLRLGLARELGFRPVVVGLTCERMDENFAAYVSKSWWGRTFSRLYMRHVYFPFFDHHIANSDHTAGELREVAAGHAVTRGVWTRPMGVDTDHFTPAKRSSETRKLLRGHFSAPGESTLLLYAGRLVPEKNLELLIATMEELNQAGRDFRLIVVGDGIARQWFQQSADSRVRGRVCLLGHVSDREQLAQIYASCDFFLHPNPKEPFGIGPLEAMASGLPLIVPDRGGVTSYTTELNAYPAPPGAEAFAQAILRACQDVEQRVGKIRAARETAELYSWPKVTDSFLSLYETIYQAGSNHDTLNAASPAFVSTPPRPGQARLLHVTSKLAQLGFSIYEFTGRLLTRFQGETRRMCETEMETM